MALTRLLCAACLLSGWHAAWAQVSHLHVPELNKDGFDDFLAGNEVVLVKFYQSWCGWCNRLKPHYEEAATKLAALNSSVRLAATDDRDLHKSYDIKLLPTLLLFAGGKKRYQYWAFDYDDLFDAMRTFDTMSLPLGYAFRNYYWLRSLYKFGVKALLKSLHLEQTHFLYDAAPHLLAPLLLLAVLILALLARCCRRRCCRRGPAKDSGNAKTTKTS
eukprot:gb/GFBE01062211.1/.p1 GENE.gb/GFBE01062211.1/~~gb/GFBE01062211.1/.p1  ORF type:complete len:217 (+),score=26.80 gb/GFBE01062211.1/:1-651(+)